MAKRKAPYTKQALHRAAASLRKNSKEVTSATLYEELKNRYKDETKKDQADIFDIGLRILCGRMTSMKPDLPDDPDLFEKERFPENFPLRVLRGNRMTTILIETRMLTPEMIDGQPPAKEKAATKENRILSRLNEMRAKGFTSRTLESYVKDQL